MSTIYRATIRPAEELTEGGKRWNHKVTAKVDTRGIEWIVEIRREGATVPELGLELEPSEQPLVALYEALARELQIDEMAAVVRLTTDVEVREISSKGKDTKRFRPLFPSLLVRVRSLRGAVIRAPNGSLPGVIGQLSMLPMPRPGVALKRAAWRGREEHLEVQARKHWFGDVMKPSQDALREMQPRVAARAAAEVEEAGGDRWAPSEVIRWCNPEGAICTMAGSLRTTASERSRSSPSNRRA